MELLLGAGNSRAKKITFSAIPSEWCELVAMDWDETCNPHVLHDLNIVPYPFEDDTFDEVHAYEILEHIGTQGDFRAFFNQFGEFHRILKPGGYFIASVPMWDSPWAWGDPGHTRVITRGSLAFLSQKEYAEQVGKTAMTDYRHCYQADFDILSVREEHDTMGFVLQAVK